MLRLMLACGLLWVSGAALAGSRIGNDGCYQLYRTAAMLPVICVSGTAEEGINGEGVRIAIIGPNSDQVNGCGYAQVSYRAYKKDHNFMTLKSGDTTFDFEGKVERDGIDKGTVVMKGKETTKMYYSKLSDAQADRLWVAFDSEMCPWNERAERPKKDLGTHIISCHAPLFEGELWVHKNMKNNAYTVSLSGHALPTRATGTGPTGLFFEVDFNGAKHELAIAPRDRDAGETEVRGELVLLSDRKQKTRFTCEYLR